MTKISKIESIVQKSKNGKLKVLYTRVSSIDQKTDRQRVSEKDYNWFLEDKISGSVKFFDRPKGSELKKLIDNGLVESIGIWTIDRAGRNLLDILQTLNYFTANGVQVNFISNGLRTLDEDGNENPIAKMVISILGVIAEMQRVQIREAQAQGIKLAKAKGVYKGRTQNTTETVAKFLSKKKNQEALNLLKKGYPGKHVATVLKMSQTTICKIKKLGLVNAQ